MIPDIALMIVAYGGMRLLLTGLAPYRQPRTTGMEVIVWLLIIAAGGALAYLGLDVLNIASNATGTNGLT